MGIFDFMTGNNPVNAVSDFTGPMTDNSNNFDFNKLLQDPNFIRTLGEVGSGLSAPNSFGKVVGSSASDLVHRRAVQDAGAEQIKRNKSFQEQMIQALSEGRLLSNKENNDLPDSVSIDGDGNMTIKAGMTPQKVGFSGEQKKLESFTGGNNLPDFL